MPDLNGRAAPWVSELRKRDDNVEMFRGVSPALPGGEQKFCVRQRHPADHRRWGRRTVGVLMHVLVLIDYTIAEFHAALVFARRRKLS